MREEFGSGYFRMCAIGGVLSAGISHRHNPSQYPQSQHIRRTELERGFRRQLMELKEVQRSYFGAKELIGRRPKAHGSKPTKQT